MAIYANVLFCEDVRQERSGKLIILAPFPASFKITRPKNHRVVFSFWVVSMLRFIDEKRRDVAYTLRFSGALEKEFPLRGRAAVQKNNSVFYVASPIEADLSSDSMIMAEILDEQGNVMSATRIDLHVEEDPSSRV